MFIYSTYQDLSDIPATGHQLSLWGQRLRVHTVTGLQQSPLFRDKYGKKGKEEKKRLKMKSAGQRCKKAGKPFCTKQITSGGKAKTSVDVYRTSISLYIPPVFDTTASTISSSALSSFRLTILSNSRASKEGWVWTLR